MKDRGPWFTSYTRRTLYVLDPRPEDICIEDIAHALSLIPRFGGHSREHYSVAVHSWLVAFLVSRKHPELALPGLLHDATEAYLGDVIKPLKWVLGDSYRQLEDRWGSVIGEAFGIELAPLHPAIKQADLVALVTEHPQVFEGEPRPLPIKAKAAPIHIRTWWRSEAAEQWFLRSFRALRRGMPLPTEPDIAPAVYRGGTR